MKFGIESYVLWKGLESESAIVVDFDDDAKVRGVRVGQIHGHWSIGENELQLIIIKGKEQMNLATGALLPGPPNALAFPRAPFRERRWNHERESRSSNRKFVDVSLGIHGTNDAGHR